MADAHFKLLCSFGLARETNSENPEKGSLAYQYVAPSCSQAERKRGRTES